MSDLIERARDPRNQFLFDPPVAYIATALLKELADALEAAEREREAMRDNLKSVQAQLDIANRLLGECEAARALPRDEPPTKEGL